MLSLAASRIPPEFVSKLAETTAMLARTTQAQASHEQASRRTTWPRKSLSFSPLSTQEASELVYSTVQQLHDSSHAPNLIDTLVVHSDYKGNCNPGADPIRKQLQGYALKVRLIRQQPKQ